MQSIQDLENQVSSLSRENLAEFRAWFETFDAENWDRQFEKDVNTGALDSVIKEAIDEYGSGKSIEL